jgi:hypothetical protein
MINLTVKFHHVFILHELLLGFVVILFSVLFEAEKKLLVVRVVPSVTPRQLMLSYPEPMFTLLFCRNDAPSVI